MTEEIKGCPWCDQKPTHDVQRYHNCGEPYFNIRLVCKSCGVTMSSIASEQEVNEGSKIAGANRISMWDGVAHAVIKNRLLQKWNHRHE